MAKLLLIAPVVALLVLGLSNGDNVPMNPMDQMDNMPPMPPMIDQMFPAGPWDPMMPMSRMDAMNPSARLDFLEVVSGATTMLTNLIQSVRSTVATVSGSVTNGVDALSNAGSNMIKNLIRSMTHRGEQVSGEINDLQQQYNESKYQKCFPSNPIGSILDSSINGVTKCVGNVLDQAQTTVNSFNASISTIMTTISGASNAEADCANSYFGQWACTQMANTMAMTGLVGAVTNITVTATNAVAYFSSLQVTLLTCAAIEARYQDYAANVFTNVTSCLYNVMNPQTPKA